MGIFCAPHTQISSAEYYIFACQFCARHTLANVLCTYIFILMPPESSRRTIVRRGALTMIMLPPRTRRYTSLDVRARSSHMLARCSCVRIPFEPSRARTMLRTSVRRARVVNRAQIPAPKPAMRAHVCVSSAAAHAACVNQLNCAFILDACACATSSDCVSNVDETIRTRDDASFASPNRRNHNFICTGKTR